MFDVGVERIKSERAAKEAQLSHEQASTRHDAAMATGEETDIEVKKQRRDAGQKWMDAMNAWETETDPEKKKAALDRVRLWGEAFSGKMGTERMTYATGVIAQAMGLAKIPLSTPMQLLTADDTAKLDVALRELLEKTKTTSTAGVDAYGNETHSSKTDATHLGGDRPLHPAPTHMGSAPAAGKKSSIGEEEYRIAKAGGKLAPKALEAANRYAIDNGLALPVPITPADRKSLAGLTNLEAALPDLEKYSTVLGSTKSRLKLQEIVNQVTKTGANSGMISSVEGFIGAGANAVLVNSLTPEEQNFLVAYNQGREAVQTMRQFAGVSRSTQALYNAMAALLPNPGQTKNQAMARDQIARLRKQIATARATVGGAPEESAPGNPPNTKKADKFGVVYE
jgi:hypothetical protein